MTSPPNESQPDPSTGTTPSTPAGEPSFPTAAGETPPTQPAGGVPPPADTPPPPPGGGFPPPPSGGGFPPPPSGGGFPPPPGAAAVDPTSVGAVLRYSWEKFKANALVWILAALVLMILTGGVSYAGNGRNGLMNNGSVGFRIALSIGIFLAAVISAVVGYLIQAALVKGSLAETDGLKPDFGAFVKFNGPQILQVILASLLVGIMTGIGFVLCIIPGLVLSFFLFFTMQFVLDAGQDAISAIKSSFSLVGQNVGKVLVVALAFLGINILGAIPCGLGLLVTIPLTVIGTSYLYRVLSGRAVY